MRSPLFDQVHAEIQTTEHFVLQNSKLLKATLGGDVLSAKGAMVAYQGQVQFQHEGSGSVSRFLKNAISSDNQPLMRVSGQGEVFFARAAEDVFLLQLEGDGISVNGSSLLAFDSALQWDLHWTKGAGALTAGLFNTLIQGQGMVALTAHGAPVLLDCSQQPTFVDPNAAVCWSANLQPGMVNSMNMRSLMRGGSGETFQYAFHGPGFVVVQPSEGYSIAGA